jgi:small-conductance mechanosensitive channel/CRP-like cAMP-binding protein
VRAPVLVRRLAGPVLVLALAVALVYGVRGMTPWDLQRGGRDYGAFFLGLALLFFFVRLFNFLAFDVAFRLRRQTDAPNLLREISALVLFFAGVLFLLSEVLQVHVTAVLATSAILTAVIGLALQDTLGNLFAGLALHLERSIQLGDVVRIGDEYGIVEALSWRALRVRTFLDSLIVLPNGAAARERLEVFPRGSRPVARTIRVGLEYSVPPTRAIEVLTRGIDHMHGVAPSPAPRAFVKDFGDSAIIYEIRYWLDDYATFMDADSRVREALWYRLEREGLQIPFPIQIRYQAEAPWAAGPAEAPLAGTDLDRVELFSPLSASNKERLASRTVRVEYGPGENVVLEGGADTALYVVVSGALVALTEEEPGREVIVGTLAPGDTFGEMALLTGEPRSATVRTVVSSRLIRIDKEALGAVLCEKPSLAVELSRLVERRRERMAKAQDRAREKMRDAAPEDSVLSRVARFFGLEVES